MREIKFRVWAIDWKDNNLNSPQGKMMYCEHRDFAWLGETAIENTSRYIVMQFTGLTDKNGKEIYKGDVILIPSSYTEMITDDGGESQDSPQIQEVIFHKGSFGIVAEKDDLFSKRFYSFYEIEQEITDNPIEVIGNIYSNPELIK